MKSFGLFLAVFFVSIWQVEATEIIVPKTELQKTRRALQMSKRTADEFEVLKIERPEDLEDVLRELDEAGILWEPNYRFSADVISTGDAVSKSIEADLNDQDPFIREQWSLYNPSITKSSRFYGGDIDWLRARSLSRGKGRLYIVDSGIDKNNPELSSKVVGAFDATNPGSIPHDENGHGTHVSSIATAAENGDGIVGVAPSEEVELVDVRMLGADNSGSTDDALRAFSFIKNDSKEYFNQNPEGFTVVNNSWGGPNFSSSLQSAMASVSGDRTLFVTSAGNDSRNNDAEGYWPCNFNIPNNICVGASDTSDFKTSFSSFGRLTVDLLAPGLHILGAAPDFRFVDKSGTSQAAPHVAGAALLVWGANPALNAAEVKHILLSSVDRLPGAESEVLSGGRLNVYRAVLMATGMDTSMADREFGSQNRGGGGCSLNSTSAKIDLAWLILAFTLLTLLRRGRPKSLS